MSELKSSSETMLDPVEVEETRQRSRSVTTSQTKVEDHEANFEGRERAQSLFSKKEKLLNWKSPFGGTLRPHKSSSTSTLFLDSTISSPKNAELMTCVGEYIHSQIRPISEITEKQQKVFEIFDEIAHPLTKMKPQRDVIPPLSAVERLVKDIFKVGQLAPESLIMGVAYINRIKNTSGFTFFPHYWRRMLLAALILASKVWEDQAVWIVDFIDLFPATTTHDLALLEKKMLALLAFDVSLKASEYGKIYFDLRAQSSSTAEHFKELKPLDKEGIEKLENRSKKYSEKNNPRNLARGTGSFDNLRDILKSPRAVLS